MLNLKVINFYAAPGVGKSTSAAGLFNLMKMRGHSVELVSEYAKDLTWKKDWMGLSHQLSILGEQDYRLRRLEGQVEWAITDSPIPMQIAYMGEEWGGIDGWLSEVAWQANDRYQNFNVLLHRPKDHRYEQAGRNQTAEEAAKLDNVIDYLFGEAEDTAMKSLEAPISNQVPYAVYNWIHEV